MGAKLDNAIKFYLGTLRDGRVRQATEMFTGDLLKQHTTGVMDGIEGYVQFFTPFVQSHKNRDVRIIRAIEDNNLVFIHAYNNFSGQQVASTNFFGFDQNDKVVEQWNVLGRYSGNTPSQHNSVDGEYMIKDEHLTNDNKFVVKDMIENLLMPGGDRTKIYSYISDLEYTEHDEFTADGLENFRQIIMNNQNQIVYQRVALMVGQGNFVATLSQIILNGQSFARSDVFRLENHKIVEHWDAMEPLKRHPVNSGKF